MKNNRNLKLIKTIDGSHSIINNINDEIYHSRFGAIQESQHIFVNNGIEICKKNNVKILEIGLGTGLNLILTYMNSKKKHIEYHAIEPYPLPTEIIEKINYKKILNIDILDKIHLSSFNKKNVLRSNFIFYKYEIKFQDFFSKNKFDIIYFDAFSPRIQPEMWMASIFKKSFSLLKENGFLVTFSAKGEVKRRLKEVGFNLNHPPGPFGKREITLAHKS